MIPLIDLLFTKCIEDGLNSLKNNPDKIDYIFSYASKKTIEYLKDVILNYEIYILPGYPRTENKLPCYIVQISGEEEVPYSLGGGIDYEYHEQLEDNFNYLNWDKEDNTQYIQENAQMRANIRVESWSDNAVITSFMYAIAKYSLLRSRDELERNGIMLQNLSGTDLEPVPDYLPTFVYRRAVTISFEYILSYHVDDKVIGKEEDHLPVGATIDDVEISMKGYSYERDKERDKEKEDRKKRF